MAQFPALPLFTDAYLGDTTHLTTIEHGAYLLLLMVAWRSKETKLPDNDNILAKYAKMTLAQWKRIKPVIEPFFNIENGAWTQGRLSDEANHVRQVSKSNSKVAKDRWLKTKDSIDTNAVRTQYERSTPTPTPTPTNSNVRNPPKKASAYSDDFEVFWKDYPRAIGKANAWKEYQKISDPLETILKGVKNYNREIKSKEIEPRYIKHASTWLKGRHWEDVYQKQGPKQEYNPEPFKYLMGDQA